MTRQTAPSSGAGNGGIGRTKFGVERGKPRLIGATEQTPPPATYPHRSGTAERRKAWTDEPEPERTYQRQALNDIVHNLVDRAKFVPITRLVKQARGSACRTATVRPSSVGGRSLLEREWAVWQQPAPWPSTSSESTSW